MLLNVKITDTLENGSVAREERKREAVGPDERRMHSNPTLFWILGGQGLEGYST